LTGFDNNEISGRTKYKHNVSCQTLGIRGEIGYQKSWLLEDDIPQIAMQLSNHPMLRYSTEVFTRDKNLKGFKGEDKFVLSDLLKRSWSRLSNSCCLLEEQQVYLCVTRVIFHGPSIVDQGAMSFVRGQIYSKSWIHLENYIIRWAGRELVFPQILEIPSFYREGGIWYGPEDPRITIEQGVEGVEPVIIYNIQEKSLDWRRVMKIYRPFSGHSVILNVTGFTDNSPQKNWSPIVLQQYDHHHYYGKGDGKGKKPSSIVHLTYKTTPLVVFACDMYSGECNVASRENTDPAGKGDYKLDGSDIRGGTNYMPVPLFDSEIFNKPAQSKFAYTPDNAVKDENGNLPVYQAFMGLPRCHSESHGRCDRAVYRPEFMLIITNGTSWVTSYVSSPFDLGPGVLFNVDNYTNVCTYSKWLIGNSIASWDFNVELSTHGLNDNKNTSLNGLHDYRVVGKTDVMTLTFSVNDVTSQAIRMTGLMNLIKELPSINQFLNDPASLFDSEPIKNDEKNASRYDRMVSTGANARSCSAFETQQFMIDGAGPEGEKRRIKKEEDDKRKKELEEKEKKKKEELEKKKKSEIDEKKTDETESKKETESKNPGEIEEKKKDEIEEKKKGEEKSKPKAVDGEDKSKKRVNDNKKKDELDGKSLDEKRMAMLQKMEEVTKEKRIKDEKTGHA